VAAGAGVRTRLGRRSRPLHTRQPRQLRTSATNQLTTEAAFNSCGLQRYIQRISHVAVWDKRHCYHMCPEMVLEALIPRPTRRFRNLSQSSIRAWLFRNASTPWKVKEKLAEEIVGRSKVLDPRRYDYFPYSSFPITAGSTCLLGGKGNGGRCRVGLEIGFAVKGYPAKAGVATTR